MKRIELKRKLLIGVVVIITVDIALKKLADYAPYKYACQRCKFELHQFNPNAMEKAVRRHMSKAHPYA